MPVLEEQYDVVIVGAGHAGCEAALAAARLGLETILFTVSIDSIALMPCNPAIGGIGKGNLVKDMDALGGEMGKNIDATGIQFRVLNKRKGPAVWCSRAQADKYLYKERFQHIIFNTQSLSVKQGIVKDILVEKGEVNGVTTECGQHFRCKKIVICGALLSEPNNWILDEPMTGLDPKSSYDLKEMMREHSKSGKTVFFSTHILEVAEKLCDRVGIINKGKLVFVGTLDEMKEKFKENGSLEELFLEITEKE